MPSRATIEAAARRTDDHREFEALPRLATGFTDVERGDREVMAR